jgi:arylsulfatase A-like enzyme
MALSFRLVNFAKSPLQVLTLLMSLAAMQAGEAVANRPNVVWLISEDNSVHYSKLYFDTGAEMPNISKLADEGILFRNAFSVAPVCSVARSTLATGAYPSRLGMQYHRGFKPVTLPVDLKPVFERMHDAGYYTSYWKKHDYNFVADLAKWDSKEDWRGRRDGQPFFHKHQFQITHESELQKANRGGVAQTEFAIPRHPDTPLFRQAHDAYNDLNRQMDAQIGEIVERLRQDGVLEETFIFYFGDHGGVLPGSKGYLYETGLHVPLVVRIPKNFRHLIDLEIGTRIDGFVEFVDISATTLHLTGIPIPPGMDGKPFMGPGISREALESRDEALGIADRFDEKCDLVRTLRKGELKYVRNYQPFNFDGLHNNYRYKMAAYREWRNLYETGKLNELQSRFFRPRPAEELYDVAKDPYETVNLTTDPRYAGHLKAMRNRLRERLISMPDLGFYPESYLIDRAMTAPLDFGMEHQEEIAGLIDTADLALESFVGVRDRLRLALASDNPWQRYWGLIVCSTFGKEAALFHDEARTLASGDSNPLVRARAAEFLALSGAQNPQAVIKDILSMSRSEMESLLILNTVVLLQDGRPGFTFDLAADDVPVRGEYVDRRLMYLGLIPVPDKYDYLNRWEYYRLDGACDYIPQECGELKK